MLSSPTMAIRLGHIDYSNCVPVHALLLVRPMAGVELVRGTPAELNAALAAGEVDAGPCSSIEYARHLGQYRILPGHAIGSRGAVRSICLETTRPLEELDGATVAVPYASATSTVLLRALLELRLGVRARLQWFEQSVSADPVMQGAAAALRIGDIALARRVPPGRAAIDLGELWTEWTGLPFAFAVWQVRAGMRDYDLRRLVRLLADSREFFRCNRSELARQHAPAAGVTPDVLLAYWDSLHFDLDVAMRRGLLHFFRLAAELGEAPAVESLDIVRVEPEPVG
jgi:chorismate dehydratase